MEDLGAIQEHFAQECLSKRKEQRAQFSATTAQMIFAVMHFQLGSSATPEDYQRALQTAVENARKLAEAAYPDFSKEELRNMWKARIN
ncbi:MAG: hypothetical protein ACREOO_19100 [bacterium]